MKKIILLIVLAVAFSSAFVEARVCQVEPERCPVLRWSCDQKIQTSAQSFSQISATIKNSLFVGNTLIVVESACFQTSRGITTCAEQVGQDKWSLYPNLPQGMLTNLTTGKRFTVDCVEYNGDR